MKQWDRRQLLGAMAATTTFVSMPAWAETAYEDWRDLVNFLPDAASLNAARGAFGGTSVGMKVQRIEDATGASANLDLYAVDITRMPAAYAQPSDLLAYMRQTLGTFLDPAISTISYYTPADSRGWAAVKLAPLGDIVIFHIGVWGPLEEQAGVVTSRSSASSWVFTPVTIGVAAPGEHPVSGNREFGVKTLPGGKARLYTRGADRVLASTLPGEPAVLAGGDRLWRSWQDRVVKFVTDQGGAAQLVAPTINRPSFSSLRTSGLFGR